MGKKAKKGTGNSKPKAIVITPHKIHAKIYFSGASFIVVDLPDTFDKNSDVDITTIFDTALSEFEKKESIDIPYDWHESSSIPMETDNEGNFIGFLYCEEYFASKGEKFRTTIQNSLIEEEEHRKQFKKGMKMFFFSV
jgi:hypothetical protein